MRANARGAAIERDAGQRRVRAAGARRRVALDVGDDAAAAAPVDATASMRNAR